MKLGRRKRKARAIASRRDRLVELVGRVGGVGDGQVFVDELWDVHGDGETALVQDAVFEVDRHFGGQAPKVGPLGDSMGADVIRVYGERFKQSVRIHRVVVHTPGKLTRSQRREMRALAAKLKQDMEYLE